MKFSNYVTESNKPSKDDMEANIWISSVVRDLLGRKRNIPFGIKIEAWTQMMGNWRSGRIRVVDKNDMGYKLFLSLVHMGCAGKNKVLLREEIHLKSLLIQR
jgi:hypothetical protein